MLDWPPPFTVRRSLRAKRLALRFDPERGLEIVLPSNMSEKKGVAFLHAQRAWVEKHVRETAHTDIGLKTAADLQLPERVVLPCINQEWPIDYIQIQSAKRVTFSACDARLLFYGNIADVTPCQPHLMSWVKAQAKVHLPVLLAQMSKTTGLSYDRVGVRGQKTLWGSCTADKAIQLNYKLLLLPDPVVRYVMLHELCHTIHLNHSAAFWRLLEDHMPDYRVQVNVLKKANQLLPRWMFA